MEKIKCQMPSWNKMHDYARKTCSLIKESGFYPDIIVTLIRGGLVPARMFCDFLHIKDCTAIKINHWGVTATPDGEAKLTQELSVSVAGKKVLIVDDITDTGASMTLAKEHVLSKGASLVKTAALIHLNGSKYTPDFYGNVQDWAWIIFPWNYMEDLVNLVKKTNSYDVKTVNKMLYEYFDVNVSHDETEIVLDHIKYLEARK